MINMHYADVEILPEHLPALDRLGSRPTFTRRFQGPAKKSAGKELQEALKDAEVKAIVNALEVVGGNKRMASEILGISIRNLYYKIKRHNIT
jgi:transcriptional regulator with PAS, ATPase and Fis domain